MATSDAKHFETGRIKALQDERVYIQKKTFTKWANAFLEKVSYEHEHTLSSSLILNCSIIQTEIGSAVAQW